MQLFPILLVVAVVVADNGIVLDGGPRGTWIVAALTLAPMGLVVAASGLLLRGCQRGITRLGPRAVVRAMRVTAAARWLILLVHAAALLVLGWLSTVRALVGDLILIDEAIALLPATLAWISLWWLHYPIERRLRDALLIRRLDEGRPIYSTPSRWDYVALQTRSGMLLLLVPLLIILALAEIIDWAAARSSAQPPPWALDVASLVGALLVFALSPLIARAVLRVQPLGPGEVRSRLLEVCRRHRVAVRQILVWHTSGTIINAAVMGLAGFLRYVLFSDALLDSMSARQVEAVMAHEVAHVRWRHMPWLVVCLLAAVSLAFFLLNGLLIGAEALGLLTSADWPSDGPPQWLRVPLVVVELAIALHAFGWVSRRFERQADTFAVQHLSGMGLAASAEDAPRRISAEAVGVVQSALGRIAELNTIDPQRHSWRHGSIAWRQRYLDSMVSQPLGRQSIDRLVRAIKVAAAVIVLAGLMLQIALPAAEEDVGSALLVGDGVASGDPP